MTRNRTAAMSGIQTLIKENTDSENNEIRLTGLRSDFIGTLSRTTLMPYNKLTLNRNNNVKFKNQ
jgi:hypothetical protein